VAGIVALAAAIGELRAENLELRKEKVLELRNYFIGRILKEIPETELNGSRELRNPNNANFYFKFVEGESILLNLDLAGIDASSGSACASASLAPSHVMMAVYDDAERAHGSIRFTLGEKTSKEEIDYTLEELKKIITRLRKLSPLAPKEYK
jgi:cysteine desulfurase